MYQKLPFPTRLLCSVYNDGSHYVARQVYKSSVQSLKVGVSDRNRDLDILFNEAYAIGIAEGLRNNKHDSSLKLFIGDCMNEKLQERISNVDIHSYVDDKVKQKWRNIQARKKRFARKAYMNKWNYFATFTYDSTKMSAEEFECKLRKCFSNLHTRRGWRYMGVFEKAPETNRVHFHCLLFIPDGEMVGELKEVHDYNTTKHCMQTAYVNTFFGERFGRTDFKELAEGMNSGLIDYILKYITKTDDKVFYSRGIPGEVSMKINIDDIVSEYEDFGTKYVLFDDVFERYKKVKANRRVYYEEQDFFELLAS